MYVEDPRFPLTVTAGDLARCLTWLRCAVTARPVKLGYSLNPWRIVPHDGDGEPRIDDHGRHIELRELTGRPYAYTVGSAVRPTESYAPPGSISAPTRREVEAAHRSEMALMIDALLELANPEAVS